MRETPFAEEAELQRLIAAHHDQPGTLLPILHAVQEAFGYVAGGRITVSPKKASRSATSPASSAAA